MNEIDLLTSLLNTNYNIAKEFNLNFKDEKFLIYPKDVVENLTSAKLISTKSFTKEEPCPACISGRFIRLASSSNQNLYFCCKCALVKEIMEEAPVYQINFLQIKGMLKELINQIASKHEELSYFTIKKDITSPILAFDDNSNITICAFEKAKTLKEFKSNFDTEKGYIIFLCESGTNEYIHSERMFFIAISSLFELNEVKTVIINQNKFNFMVFKALYNFIKSKGLQGETIRKAAKYWALSIINNQTQITKYKKSGGRELFIEDSQKNIKGLTQDYAEKLWKQEMKPMI